MRRSRITLLCLVISAVLSLAVAVSAQASTAAGPAVHSGYGPGRGTTSRIITDSTASPDSSGYYKGYATACGGTVKFDCKSWWVDLHITITVSGDQAWVNGFTSKWCTAGGTKITWCGYSGNGTDDLSIGANFGNGGWFRLFVTPLPSYPDYTTESEVSWANYGALCVGLGNACYTGSA